MVSSKEMAESIEARCKANDEWMKKVAPLTDAGWLAGNGVAVRPLGCDQVIVSLDPNGKLRATFPVVDDQLMYFDTAEEVLKYVDEIEQHLGALR